MPRGVEDAVCTLARRERAVFSCPAALAGGAPPGDGVASGGAEDRGAGAGPGGEQPGDAGASGGAGGRAGGAFLVPPPPPGAERVELELHLLSMLQARQGQGSSRSPRPLRPDTLPLMRVP